MMEAILPAPQTQYYRNKLEYTFSNKRWLTDIDDAHEGLEMRALGFHVPSRFDKILDIEHCYLQQDPSNAIRNGLRSFALQHDISFYDLRQHEGALRNLIIRTRSEERRGGKECVSTSRSRWSPDHDNKTPHMDYKTEKNTQRNEHQHD